MNDDDVLEKSLQKLLYCFQKITTTSVYIIFDVFNACKIMACDNDQREINEWK